MYERMNITRYFLWNRRERWVVETAPAPSSSRHSNFVYFITTFILFTFLHKTWLGASGGLKLREFMIGLRHSPLPPLSLPCLRKTKIRGITSITHEYGCGESVAFLGNWKNMQMSPEPELCKFPTIFLYCIVAVQSLYELFPKTCFGTLQKS